MTHEYLITEDQLRRLERMRTRLHSEIRMDGDLMRDFGHALDAIVRECREMQLTKDVLP